MKVVGQIFEGLVGLNGNNEVIPLVSDSWTHDKTYSIWRFHIRKGIFFHDDACFGPRKTREVNAEDVRYSLERSLLKTSFPSFILLDSVKGAREFQTGKVHSVIGIKPIDQSNIEIQLLHPEPTFLDRISSPWISIFPKESAQMASDVWGRTKAIGTGPFRLVSRSDIDVILEKNPEYWRQVHGNLDQIHFKVIKNEQICLSELRNGHISIFHVPLDLIPGLIDVDNSSQNISDKYKLKPPLDKDFFVKCFRIFDSHFLSFNCERMDIHLRRAISFAINRQELVQSVTHNSAVLSTGLVPIGMRGYQPAYPKDIFNLEMAKAELKQTKSDLSHPIELLLHEKMSSEQQGQLIQDQLKKIGLSIRLNKIDFNTVVDKLVKGQTEACSIWFQFVYSAPGPILDVFKSTNIPVPNFFHYKNPSVDAGIRKILSEENRQEANRLAREVEKQTVDDAPCACLYQLNDLMIFRKTISNLAFTGLGVPLLYDTRLETE